MRVFDKKWCFAQLNLAYRLLLHLIKWPFARMVPHGEKRFLQNYGVDLGFLPSAEFSALLHEPSRCTACGLCDVACPLIGIGLVTAGEPLNFIGPMHLVLGAMQGGERLKAAKAELLIMSDRSCDSCRACDRACPEHIPITQLASHYVAAMDRALVPDQTVN